MIDIGQATALLGSLKTAGEIGTALIGLRDARVVEDKVRELNGVILSAQQGALAAQLSQIELLDRVRTLEAEVARMKEWDRSKEAYHLKAVRTGAFAYVAKPSVNREEPPHWLCVKCYNDRHKSILQAKGRTKDNRSNVWACPSCASEIIVPWSVNPESLEAEQTAPNRDG